MLQLDRSQCSGDSPGGEDASAAVAATSDPRTHPPPSLTPLASPALPAAAAVAAAAGNAHSPSPHPPCASTSLPGNLAELAYTSTLFAPTKLTPAPAPTPTPTPAPVSTPVPVLQAVLPPPLTSAATPLLGSQAGQAAHGERSAREPPAVIGGGCGSQPEVGPGASMPLTVDRPAVLWFRGGRVALLL